MATQVGGVIQDQNLNIHYNGASIGGKSNVLKAQKKASIGGRRALADISGTPNQPLKNINSNNFATVKKEMGATKSPSHVGPKKNVCKAKGNVQASGRKPLSDISNSRKPWVHQLSEKGHGKILNAVVEEQIHSDTIAEENFLHNHQECIKSQKRAVDVDYVLKIVGLEEDFFMKPTLQPEFSVSRKSKAENPLGHPDLEEMAELPIEDGSPPGRKAVECKSPPPCWAPESPSGYSQQHWEHWEDHELPSFVLIETPVLPKH